MVWRRGPSDIQALFSTTLGSDSSLRPLCLLTPGLLMGKVLEGKDIFLMHLSLFIWSHANLKINSVSIGD